MWIDVQQHLLKILFIYFTSSFIPKLSQHNLQFKLHRLNYCVNQSL
jgi:hypothetical protein